MSQPKKHPLEVFQANPARGGLGGAARPGEERAAAAAVPDAAGGDPAEPAQPRYALHLELPGLFALLFAFIVLMAASYVYGFGRGEAVARGELDAAALSRGRAVERVVASETSPSDAAAAAQEAGEAPWYGVLVSTYGAGKAALAEEVVTTLTQRYGLSGFVRWTHEGSGKVEVFVGASREKNDVALKQLEHRLRMIDDYPSGAKSPFKSATIRTHPGDPRAQGAP